jgi:F0F1-type ATP synthase membrane subunit b/b'
MTIDILALVDRLENIVNQGWRIPFTMKTVIEEDRFYDIIDQLRVSIPEEVRRADELLSERERVLAGAQDDAERIIREAQAKAERLLDESEIAAAARAEAERIKSQAQRDADAFRKEADDYALEALGELEARLSALLRQTANGLATLRHRLGETVSEDLEEPS